ncbi:hypothetical protein Sdiek1_1540 [Sulfurospirillum diekertiae]|uniref:Uncharacterized protein n=1 Tax=Sulfurospirillum diekertiae TaxID=1854492 RepID=A0A1Y0HNC4_9BACT|nr:hypothetical protein Sdiek1_1540 [Sulfurospirillum diekertiae]
MIAILKYFPSKIIALVTVCTIALLPIHIHAAEKK